jgi:aryl-alcohol dehydrogenase-like predicted oxidoreductase
VRVRRDTLAGFWPGQFLLAVKQDTLRKVNRQEDNFFDTANAYGPRTVNRLIAAALHPTPMG